MTNNHTLVEYTFDTEKFYSVQSSVHQPGTVFYLTVDNKQFYVDEGSFESRRKVWKQRRNSRGVTSEDFFSLPNVTVTTNVGRSSYQITSVMFVSKNSVLVKTVINNEHSYGMFLDSLDSLRDDLRSKLVQIDVTTWKFDEICRFELDKVGKFKYEVMIDGVRSGFFVNEEKHVFRPDSSIDVTMTKTTLGDVSHYLIVDDATVLVSD